MNVLGIGTGELLLIMIIAAMVVGPDQMVRLSRSAGRLLGKLRRETDGIRQEFREAISTFDDVSDIAEEAKAALGDIQTEVKKAGADVQEAAADIRQVASETKAAAISAGAASATPPTPTRPPTAGPVAPPLSSVPRAATTTAAPARPVAVAAAAPKPAPAPIRLIDGEVELATPRVFRSLLPDEAAEVDLAQIVPDDPAEAKAIEIPQPTLVIDLKALAAAPASSATKSASQG